MRKSQIQVGHEYTAKVSNQNTTVVVDSIDVHNGRTVYNVTNTSTGRKVVFKSAAQFKGEIPQTGAVVPDQGIGAGTQDQVTATQVESKLNARLAGRKVSTTIPHLIVVARAGTGKTTTLVEGLKLIRGLPTPFAPSPQQAAVWDAMELSPASSSVCFVAFNRSIAVELAERVPEGCNAQTMHALGLKAVRNTFTLTRGRDAINGWKVQNLIGEILNKDLRDLRRTQPELLQATNKLVGLCKMNLTEPTENALAELASQYDVDLNSSRSQIFDLVPVLLDRCRDVDRDGYIDFNDMIWLPVALNLPTTKYDLLLVDEAQDLNRCQQELALRSGRRLILCGDPRQAIYGFAGADSQSMDRMYDRLHATDAGCDRLPLTVTRRCGRAIVEEAQKYVPDFEYHESVSAGSVSHESIKAYPEFVLDWSDGNSQIFASLDLAQAAFERETNDAVYEQNELVTNCLGEDGTTATITQRMNPGYRGLVDKGDMILCRVNAPLVQECFRFLREGRRAQIQGRDIGQNLIEIVQKQKAETIEELISSLSDWYEDQNRKENSKLNPNEQRLIALSDKHDCLQEFCVDAKTPYEVVDKIKRLFTDDLRNPGILLSSGHKAKGLEADRVFLLQPEGASCPHPMARTKMAIDQEYNLLYVMITRALHEVVYVS